MRFSRVFLIAFCALVLCGPLACVPKESAPDPVDELPEQQKEEIIDACTDDQPCTLIDGSSGTDFIDPEGDSDTWTFDVPSAGRVVNVVVSNDSDFSPIRLEVVLFGPNGQSIVNDRFQGNGKQRVEIQLTTQAAGEHEIIVRDVGNDGADRRNGYVVIVNLLSETDNNEPNDAKGQATRITSGSGFSGTIGFQGDEDWFTFDVPANKLIQVEASAPGDSEVRLQWELWNDSDTRLAQSNEPQGSTWPTELRAVGNAAGTYYLKVLDNPSDGQQADLGRLYLITISYLTEPDPFDLSRPNESKETAKMLSAGQQVSALVAATADQDWYSIQVNNASSGSPQIIAVYATMGGTSNVDLSFEVFMPDGETAICDDRDEDECRALRFVTNGNEGVAHLETAHLITNPGTYYVLVRDHQDNEYDTGTSYTVKIDLPAEPDANENYGRGRGSAITISSGQWVEGYIGHTNDEDWYEFSFAPGDWMLDLELQKEGPTRIELEAFFYGGSRGYGGYGKRCREPSPQDLNFCQWPDSQNGIDIAFGPSTGDCFVVLDEGTGDGRPHYFRMSDLDRDDHDLRPGTGKYRFRVTLHQGCGAVCESRYGEYCTN